jgi:hypothetical protein
LKGTFKLFLTLSPWTKIFWNSKVIVLKIVVEYNHENLDNKQCSWDGGVDDFNSQFLLCKIGIIV